jgi:hypothetical protein
MIIILFQFISPYWRKKIQFYKLFEIKQIIIKRTYIKFKEKIN